MATADQPAATRPGRGENATRRVPTGLMTEWLWQTLARLYPAGERGLPRDARPGAPRAGQAPSWASLLRLRDRRDGPYMEEFTAPAGTAERELSKWWARLTSLGRDHYERHYACYRELYPGVPAQRPAAAPGAHAGVADHCKRRPPGLLREPSWRILARLATLEQSGTCHLRHVLTEEYRGLGRDVPESVTTIPCGLLDWEIQRVTRSSAAAAQLLGYPGGPLAEIVDVTNLRWGMNDPETLPLLCLSPGGRAHYAAHWHAYRVLYPDVIAPEPPPDGGAEP